MSRPLSLTALALGILIALPAGVWADTRITPFSTMADLDDGWEPLEFPKIDRHTNYRLVEEDGTQVIEASTDNSASGLIARLDLEPGESLMLTWRWKVSNVFDQGDARKKSGDDYPARIYVAFEFEPQKASWFERAKRKTVATVFGEELPGNAINYIWANRLPRGETVANPYSEETMMIAVTSGNEQAGEWVTVKRDLVADYRAAFGEDPPPIRGVAIMSDSDNTGESATAWYGDLELGR
ncbi:DUF3047 domain-containing protein [Marinobacter goseongensis]|uniref:DUF3047 domain-containing protein n=1 Tax=Marinobacter goseongensis TaxID=453838 RepID=UPI00200365A6|nr:DUF3047 domain-containing protein [Marinobacter goseongensis]MCK7550727.1 DUF3047 domain-containing protein [Marinobacter goseongensis]